MIIKISKNKVYLNEKEFIPFLNTNLPQSTFMFKSHLEIFWEAEIKEIDIENKSRTIEITDYYSNDKEQYLTQKNPSKFEKLKFVNLVWEKLEDFLAVYQKESLEELLLYGQRIENLSPIKWEKKYDFTIDHIEEHKVSFEFPISKIEFQFGFVELTKKFKFYPLPIKFKINNEYLRQQYEYIKLYFAKVLGKRNINVTAEVRLKNGKILEIKSSSREIDQINENLINQVRKVIVLNIPKIVYASSREKSILTVEEVFKKVETTNSKVEDSRNIIEILLKQKKVRNEKQIKYLVESHMFNEKILFTLKPHFGFIFYMAGRNFNYFCWELLNSHATYLWGFKNEEGIEDSIKTMERTISLIREIGRIEYKKCLREKVPFEYTFKFLPHYKARESSLIEFEKWKAKVENLLKK